jgi:hypothetical protein
LEDLGVSKTSAENKKGHSPEKSEDIKQRGIVFRKYRGTQLCFLLVNGRLTRQFGLF